MNVVSHIICEATPIPINFIYSVTEKATGEGNSSPRTIFQLDTESGNIQVTVLVFTNTNKDVIPVQLGVWIAVEWGSLVSNHRDIGIDCGPVTQSIIHTFIILLCPCTKYFHSMQSSIIQWQVHD